MQIGSRWAAGSPPHPRVPKVLYPAIQEAEAAHPDAVAWTLTWLEGRPQCALDDVAQIRLSASGAVESARPDESWQDADDDDWLS